MSKTHKDNRPSRFRLVIIDDETHQHLFKLRFTKTTGTVAIISTVVMFTAIIFCLIAFTPVRTFIPGYPDARTKRAAIQNAIRIDSLESVIYRWELYSENLRRVVEGEEPLKIDSIINARHEPKTIEVSIAPS